MLNTLLRHLSDPNANLNQKVDTILFLAEHVQTSSKEY